MQLNFWHLLFIVFLYLPASAKIADPTPQSPDPVSQITHNGQSRQALFMDNENIIYVSRGRKEHQDPQLYVRDLITGIEKRITYQRGHIVNGLWLNKNKKIVYSSSTDEAKETPQQLKEYITRFPASIDSDFFFHLNFLPMELYSSNPDGTNISRLSYHPGFDAFPAYDSNNRTMYFSRLDDGKINIYYQRHGSIQTAHRAMNTQGHDLGLQISPKNDHFVWYRFSPDFKSSQIMMSNNKFKNQKFLTIDDGIQWTPSWHPNQQTVVFSAKKGKDKNYELYEVSLATTCQRKLTSLPGDEFYPTVSEDGKRLVFTSTVTGKEQIHQIDYPSPFNCEIQ